MYLEKYLYIAIMFKISTRFKKCYRKLNPTLLHLSAIAFFQVVCLAKYFNITILFRISPRFMKCYRKFNPTFLHWAMAFKKKKVWRSFEKCSPDLGSFFLHRKTNSLKYWTRRPSFVCPSVTSVSPSVFQSVSHWYLRIF